MRSSARSSRSRSRSWSRSPSGSAPRSSCAEVGGRFATVVRTVVEAMTALPSIVAGLFIYTVFIVALNLPPSGLAASMAIGVMMLPIIARAADVVLRVVPGGLREAGPRARIEPLAASFVTSSCPPPGRAWPPP